MTKKAFKRLWAALLAALMTLAYLPGGAAGALTASAAVTTHTWDSAPSSPQDAVWESVQNGDIIQLGESFTGEIKIPKTLDALTVKGHSAETAYTGTNIAMEDRDADAPGFQLTIENLGINAPNNWAGIGLPREAVLTVKGSCSVAGGSAGGYGNGIYFFYTESTGTLIVERGAVLKAVSAGTGADNYALYSNGGLNIQNDGEIIAEGGGRAIGARDSMTISGIGSMIANGSNHGIYCDGSISIESGKITASGGNSSSGAIRPQPVFGDALFVTASPNKDGSSPEDYDPAKHNSYRYIKTVMFAGGDGTSENPYLIKTAAQLDNVRKYPGEDRYTGHYFQLENDIDLTEYLSPGNPGYHDGKGWEPGGVSGATFYGSFDGNGHEISGLWINRPEENDIGLFGYTYASVSNLGVRTDDDKGGVVGKTRVGILCGSRGGGSIINCYAVGKVSGDTFVGGLIGLAANDAPIQSNFAQCEVTGTGDNIGGLIGSGYNRAKISNCYAAGKASGKASVGGLVGDLVGTGTNCYAAVTVSGTDRTGGLLGQLLLEDSAVNCYFDADAAGTETGVGKGDASGVTVKTTAEMTEASLAEMLGAAFVSKTDPGVLRYPELAYFAEHTNPGFREASAAASLSPLADFAGGDGTSGNPYLIKTAAQLDNMRKYPGEDRYTGHYFRLENDIDLTEYLSPGNPGYHDGKGWQPVGVNGTTFYGSFDGNGHEISGLWINRPEEDRVGLFGETYGNVSKLGVRTDDGKGGVVGKGSVGILCGYRWGGSIINCYAVGKVSGSSEMGGLVGFTINDAPIIGSFAQCEVTGTGDSVGGLIGAAYNRAQISDCYAVGKVSGKAKVGGVIGNLLGTMTNCYATVTVSGTDETGGIVGRLDSDYPAVNCYFDTAAAGTETGVGNGNGSGVVGLSTAGLWDQTSYAGWDFIESGKWVWDAEYLYPRLREISPAVQSYPYRNWFAVSRQENRGEVNVTPHPQMAESKAAFSPSESAPNPGQFSVLTLTGGSAALRLPGGTNYLHLSGTVDGQTVTQTAGPYSWDPYCTLSVTGGKITAGEAEPDGKYLSGTEVTITADVSENQWFEGWYENDARVSHADVYTFEIDRNRSLTARYGSPEQFLPADPEGVLTGEAAFSSSGSRRWRIEDENLCSGGIDHNEASNLYLTVNLKTPCKLTFDWKANSESYDRLAVLLDGMELDVISGDLNWAEKAVYLPAGEHTVQWRYQKDWSVDRGSDCGFLKRLKLLPAEAAEVSVQSDDPPRGSVTPGSGQYPIGGLFLFTAVPAAGHYFQYWQDGSGNRGGSEPTLPVVVAPEGHSFTAVFGELSENFAPLLAQGSEPLTFHTWGSIWTMQSDGSAKSGALGDSDMSVLQTTVTVPTGERRLLMFDTKASPAQNEYLEIRINGRGWNKFSGATDWYTDAVILSEGDNRIEWRYARNTTQIAAELALLAVPDGTEPAEKTDGRAAKSGMRAALLAESGETLSVSFEDGEPPALLTAATPESCGWVRNILVKTPALRTVSASCDPERGSVELVDWSIDPVDGKFYEGSWVGFEAVAKEGYYFTGWRDQSGNVVTTSQYCDVLVTGDAAYTAVFETYSAYHAIVQENSRQYVEFGPGEGERWTMEGNFARSGDVRYHPYASTLKAEVNVPQGGAQLFSFEWKVSSDPNSNAGLMIFIDGSHKGDISGIGGGWNRFVTELEEGPHTVEWKYRGGGDDPAAENCGWVRDISIKQAGNGFISLNLTPDMPGNANSSQLGRLSEGTPVLMTAQPDPGYACVGWKDDNNNLVSQGPDLSTVVYGSRTYAPVFEKESAVYDASSWRADIKIGDDSGEFALVFAAYDRRGVMTSQVITKKRLYPGKSRILAPDGFEPNPGDTVKVFVWDSMEGMKPLIENLR